MVELQLRPCLPDESGSVGHHAVRVVLVFGDVVDEGEDELHPRLHQHHVGCRGGEEMRVREQVKQTGGFFYLLGPAKPGSCEFGGSLKLPG